jgi:O-antigen ligase
LRDPLFGSGYGTLTKSSVEQFTEAESTDNNFLRTLGENGAIGFFFYYGTVGLALWYCWEAYKKSRDPWLTALAIGGFAGTVGLLVNAVYIDVFVASKVAYTFWTLQGILMAVFVKEGLITPQFAFERQKVQQDTKNLGELLKKVDQSAQAKTARTNYLSPTKRRLKSTTQKKKHASRQ